MRDDGSSRYASRSAKKGKKRKANKIYNILLAVVIIAIVIVGASIFMGSNDNDQSTPKKKVSDNSEQTANDSTEDKKEDGDSETNASDSNDDNAEEQGSDDESQVSDDESSLDEDNSENNQDQQATDTENADEGSEADEQKNASTGTTQSENGKHVADYTMGSADWKAMEAALAAGAGIDQNNMTISWLGNNGATDKAVGTVTTKDRSATYRVQIDWVDGGWKPVKVEKLK